MKHLFMKLQVKIHHGKLKLAAGMSLCTIINVKSKILLSLILLLLQSLTAELFVRRLADLCPDVTLYSEVYSLNRLVHLPSPKQSYKILHLSCQ